VRVAAATIVLVIVAGCSSSGVPGGTSADQAARANYQAAVCGAIVSLAGNRDDFTTFKSDSSYEAAVAALARVQQRTRAAVDRLEASGSWSPGKSVSQRLVSNQQELLSILAEFETVTQTGSATAWQAATSRYDSWYSSSVTMLQGVAASLEALGVSCV
jgi:hypothetical protein